MKFTDISCLSPYFISNIGRKVSRMRSRLNVETHRKSYPIYININLFQRLGP